MIASAWAILRFEVLTLLRTREAYTFGLLPATLLVPLSLATALLVATFTLADAVVAVPREEPPGFELVAALGEELELVPTDDPAAALEAGEVDIAVLAWSGPQEDDDTLRVSLAGAPGTLDQATEVIREAVADAIDMRLEAAGGQRMTDRVIARIDTGPDAWSDPAFARRLLPLYGVFVSAYLGCFLVPVRTASERLSGTLESFGVTRTPAVVLFALRAGLGAAFGLALVSLPVLTIAVLFGNEFSDELAIEGVAQSAPLLLEAALHLLLFNVYFVACGLFAGSTRLALYAGSYGLLLVIPVYGLHYVEPLPWVPLVGIGADEAIGPLAFRIVGTLALLGGLLALLAAFAQGEQVLPPGEGDE